MTRKQRRMTILGVGLACLAVATALVLTALSDKVTFFYSPSDLAADDAGHNARIRLGGMVEEGSVVKEGTRELRDLNFMMKINIHRDDALRYEKALIKDWVRKDLKTG